MPTFDVQAYFGATPFSQAMATREAVLQTMQANDLTSVALLPSLAVQCDFVAGNRLLREVVSPGDGLFGWAVLNAGYPAESQEEQRRYGYARGIVGAALVGAPGRPVTLDDAREILNAQRRYARPVALFVLDSDAAHEARRIVAEFPAMKFVFLGMGGDDWRVAATIAKQHLNVYLEISGSRDADKIAQASSLITPRKLLYGSGLPHAGPELTRALVETAATLTRADRQRILSENAIALLRAEADAPGDAGDEE